MKIFHFLISALLLVSLISCKTNKKDPLKELLPLLLLYLILFPSDVACGDSNDTPTDPFFSSQWHLSNDGTTTSAAKNEDARVLAAWNQGCKGGGVSVVAVDDGMDIRHEDLTPNYDSSLNRDYTGQNVFSTTASCTTALGCHGTAVSGILAARDGNAIGVSGAAPRAKLGARNVLFNSTDSNASDAMSNNAKSVFVSNNSWGAPDNLGTLAPAGSLWQAGIDTGLSTGRNGKGTIFFWAAGNGGRSLNGAYGSANPTNVFTDNSNYDGQANYYGVNAVCAVGNDGKRASYSEEGANLLVCAHSLGNNTVGIFTTDITSSGGYNRGTSSTEPTNTSYTNSFNGTSAAAPLAAGVTALVLDANPTLTSRDVRVILARSGRQVDTSDAGWFTNGGGLRFNHKYGFGAIDAASAVTLAKSWTNISAEIIKSITGTVTNASVANNNPTGATNTASVSSSGIGKIEFVELTLSVTTGASDDPGDLQIELTSPAGKTTILAVPRACLNSTPSYIRCSNFSAYRFGATTFMDESADGTWSLKISDLCTYIASRSCSTWGGQTIPGLTGTGTHSISSWTMKIRGRAN